MVRFSSCTTYQGQSGRWSSDDPVLLPCARAWLWISTAQNTKNTSSNDREYVGSTFMAGKASHTMLTHARQQRPVRVVGE